ncbi:phosphoglycerate mutase [candidate division KSB1 bacterium]|nr:MAG: phosphoglycerate mutase [candidate division KSB1 bacterium]
MDINVLKSLLVRNTTKIVYLIMDGLGGLPDKETGLTELETANTPNLDSLAEMSICGMMDPIAPGITPGSGPAHLSLFGYDPLEFAIGRGILSALGIDFPIKKGDVAARINFATIDKEGKIIDRRAGRISTETNRRLCEKLRKNVKLNENVKWFIETVSEHRAVLVFRGQNLSGKIEDTDPQVVGKKPLKAIPLEKEAEYTANIINDFISKAKAVLKDEDKANMILVRGFATFEKIESMKERYGLNCLAIAEYPMYRGLARLVGMDILKIPGSFEELLQIFSEHYNEYDFFFLHVKKTDSYGEDGNFKAKVEVIEKVDKVIVPEIMKKSPDVFVVTGDHSTPYLLKSHSWHPVPLILYSKVCRKDSVKKFGESECTKGGLGRMLLKDFMPVVLANALRIQKYGA